MADKLYWIDANGTEQLLSMDENYKVLFGMNGRFMPPISVVEEEVPFQAGTRKRSVKINARDVDIPLHISAESEIELRQIMRKTLRMINPLKNEGKLISIAADGSKRELTCQYIGGMEGAEDKDSKGFWWQRVVLVFRAFDPFWYDSTTNVQTFRINETAGTFFPILPLRLSSSTVFADISITNSGDVETAPEWIITGPCQNIVISNMTTGEKVNLEVTLDVGETISIDTRPFKKTITKNDGTNLFYTMTDESSLWSLQEGENSIQLEMSNATTESSIQLSYKNRYWGV
ncbi:phage tail domain-containing protein [Bacillus sp. ISL-46]|uniref:phage distal tail protein n=1 Tax=Bacillus sp. ISL-46 TaxID=2819129 RepID=UPI001BED3053|nr:phage tail domain-containing protein [Bacillus sp. ISL-46]MBT2723045.1 phage tail family protein [Bacillus sp. ISL-46]